MSYEEYCTEAIKEIEKVRMELADQVKRLQEIKVDSKIIVERYKEYRGNVVVIVKLEITRTLDRTKRTESIDRKVFGGTQKKQALLYADELRKKHGFGIVKINWK